MQLLHVLGKIMLSVTTFLVMSIMIYEVCTRILQMPADFSGSLAIVVTLVTAFICGFREVFL